MAQLIVRDIPQSVKALLARRARENGRSMEEEVRHILRKAAMEKPVKQEKCQEKGVGTQIAELFSGIGFTKEEKRIFDASVAKMRRAKPRRVKLPA